MSNNGKQQYHQLFHFPSPTCRYPFKHLFPVEFKTLKTEKFHTFRNKTLPLLESEPKLDAKWTWGSNLLVFDEFLRHWTAFVFVLLADGARFVQPFPIRFAWSSTFDTREYSFTCVLFETIMLWHTRALLYYHMAILQENEKSIENSKTLMTNAYHIWDVMCRGYILAWTVRDESQLPIECREDGVSFFARAALCKMHFYQCIDYLPTKRFPIFLIERLAHSAREVQTFIDIVKASHQRSLESGSTLFLDTSLLLQNCPDFSIYEALAILKMLYLHSNNLRNRHISSSQIAIKSLLSFGNRLILQYGLDDRKGANNTFLKSVFKSFLPFEIVESVAQANFVGAIYEDFEKERKCSEVQSSILQNTIPSSLLTKKPENEVEIWNCDENEEDEEDEEEQREREKYVEFLSTPWFLIFEQFLLK